MGLKSVKVLLFLVCFVSLAQGYGQAVMQPGDPRFNFKDGVYLDLEDYKQNAPAITFRDFCDENGKPAVDIVLNRKSYYKTPSGEIKALLPKEIFGYARKGVFNIRVIYSGETYFDRLVVIGNLSHFICEVRNMYYDPYTNMQPTYTIHQFIFDYETGNISVFELESFETFLKRDEELFTEFSALPKKKKKDRMFFYLRKYNEKHPVYFPV